MFQGCYLVLQDSDCIAKYFAITEEILTPLVEGVVANISVILPIGLGLFAVFLGIRIIPGLVSRFVKIVTNCSL